MNKGDTVRLFSGRPARYDGGILGQGAQFTYLDSAGNPVWDSHNQCFETVCIASVALLAKLQPESERV